MTPPVPNGDVWQASMNPNMFNETWFLKYQKVLLSFANSFIGRYILRISGRRSSVGKNKIVKILPHAIFWKKGKKMVAEFRTHDKFGKRLYYAFKPIWHLFHLWDMVWYPNLNLGFDTLTKYPDTGTGNTSADGYAAKVGAFGPGGGFTWAAIIAASGSVYGVTDASNSPIYIQCGDDENNYTRNYRGKFTFDTSSLTSGATDLAGTFSVYGVDKRDLMTATPNVNVYASGGDDNDVTTTDYESMGSTAFCDTAVTYAGFSTSAYNDFSLNASGVAAISKTGVTKLGVRNANYDVAASAPPWTYRSDSYITMYFADQTGTSNDPKLVVTYTAPASFFAVL